jgi:hypothetical protein
MGVAPAGADWAAAGRASMAQGAARMAAAITVRRFNVTFATLSL